MDVCNGGPEYTTFYVTGDGPTFCESTNFVSNGFTNLYGYIFAYYDGYVMTINVNGTNVGTQRDTCVACPTPTPTPTATTANCDLMKLDPHWGNFANGVLDSTGNDNNGTVNGTFVTSTYNNYSTVVFDGTTNYIIPPSFGTQLNTGAGFSYEMWVYPTTTNNGTLISEWETSVGSGWRDAQIAFVNGQINAGVYNLGYITGPSFNANTWYHIILTYNGTNQATLYVNNVNYGSISGEKSSNQDILLTFGAPDQGGGVYLGGATGYFQGYLGYWNVYRCWFTSEVVNQNYTGSVLRFTLPTPTPTGTPTPTSTDIPSTPTPTPTSTDVPPTPTPTPTQTGTPTPTPTPTQAPLDFTFTYNCTQGGNSDAYGFTGGSGVYDITVNVYTTESDALNAVLWNQLFSPNVHAGVLYGADGTYWTAIRDRNNPSNKIAKSITINCTGPTPTPTDVSPTPTPTPTVETFYILSQNNNIITDQNNNGVEFQH
jgi:hypothetical protein